MKALVYTSPEQLEFLEVPDPVPRPEEALVRIDSVGICGSDMHGWLGHDDRRPAPLILGHEAAGVIAGGPREGERVTINPLVSCGKRECPACSTGRDNLCDERQIISMPPREGAFAQFVAIPEANLVTVPVGFPLEWAALAEPMAVSWHAVRLVREGTGKRGFESAIVIGGGAIGFGAALALLEKPVHVTLVEANAVRRDYAGNRAERLAADPDGFAGGSFKVVDPDSIGDSYEVVIDAVGNDATRAMSCALVRPGGIIAHVGLGGGSGGVDMRRITLREITLVGTYAYAPGDFVETTRMMFKGIFGDLNWTEIRSLSDGAGAFQDIRAGRTAAPKITLKPWES